MTSNASRLSIAALVFLLAAVASFLSPSNLRMSPIAGNDERRLSKNHHNSIAEEKPKQIDYRNFSCASYRHVRSEYKDTFQACQFAHNCNEGEGVIFPVIFCDGDGWPTGDEPVGTPDEKSGWSRRRWSHHNLQVPVYFAISLLLLLLFRLLNSTTDEFFSPGLEHFSLQLGLPPRFAGVTLLALGKPLRVLTGLSYPL